MDIYDIPRRNAENIQDILEWVLNESPHNILSYQDYNANRRNSVLESDFLISLNVIKAIKPQIMRSSGNLERYFDATSYFKSYMLQGGFITQYDKIHKKKQKEDEIKNLEIKNIELSIQNGLRAIEIAEESNLIAKNSINAAKISNTIALVSAIVALIALIISILSK